MRQVMLGTYLVWRDEDGTDAVKILARDEEDAVAKWAESFDADGHEIVGGATITVCCKGPHGDTTKYRVRGEATVTYYVDEVEEDAK